MNSFSAIGRAIDVEFRRQADLYESGQSVHQETRGWNDDKQSSYSLRSKEDAMDYRYFPEPDLPPLIITEAYISERQPDSLPIDRRLKYLNEYKLQEDDARILSLTRSTSDYYDALVQLTDDPKKSCSYMTSILMGLMRESEQEVDFDSLIFAKEELACVIRATNARELSSSAAQTVIETLFATGGSAEKIIDQK